MISICYVKGLGLSTGLRVMCMRYEKGHASVCIFRLDCKSNVLHLYVHAQVVCVYFHMTYLSPPPPSWRVRFTQMRFVPRA